MSWCDMHDCPESICDEFDHSTPPLKRKQQPTESAPDAGWDECIGQGQHEEARMCPNVDCTEDCPTHGNKPESTDALIERIVANRIERGLIVKGTIGEHHLRAALHEYEEARKK